MSETPQVAADEIGEALLDMRELAAASEDELRAGLTPIAEKYGSWLDGEEARANQLPDHLRDEGLDAVNEARKVQRQLAAGIEHLLGDADALRCFRFMNEVMADQRVQSQVARRRAQHPADSLDEARAAVLAGGQAALVAHVPARVHPDAAAAAHRPGRGEAVRGSRQGAAAVLPDRWRQDRGIPGAGGLRVRDPAAAGRGAYRRTVPLDGRAGVTVLMRYTLRLLTAQQFQRATALVCAAEMARRRDVQAWGDEPFRIGLWVGTDVSPKRYEEAKEQLKRSSSSGGYSRLTVLQFQRCPWCGTPISAANVRPDDRAPAGLRVLRRRAGGLPLLPRRVVAEGLPVLTVDEEIYRLAPAFVIATVDKFARLAREGEAAALFGYVAEKCELHGYVHPDSGSCKIRPGASTRKTTAYRRPVTRLRPPDLIIQDELHLITGALGTTVGLFEVAVDALCCVADRRSACRCGPLLVASTATARNAAEQVRALYGRDTTIFPPQVLDVGKTFFSTRAADFAGVPGSAVHRDQHHRGPAHHRGDPGVRCADGGRAAAARPVRRRRRSVPDAGRVLQRDPRAGGHGPVHRR